MFQDLKMQPASSSATQRTEKLERAPTESSYAAQCRAEERIKEIFRTQKEPELTPEDLKLFKRVSTAHWPKEARRYKIFEDSDSQGTNQESKNVISLERLENIVSGTIPTPSENVTRSSELSKKELADRIAKIAIRQEVRKMEIKKQDDSRYALVSDRKKLKESARSVLRTLESHKSPGSSSAEQVETEQRRPSSSAEGDATTSSSKQQENSRDTRSPAEAEESLPETETSRLPEDPREREQYIEARYAQIKKMQELASKLYEKAEPLGHNVGNSLEFDQRRGQLASSVTDLGYPKEGLDAAAYSLDHLKKDMEVALKENNFERLEELQLEFEEQIKRFEFDSKLFDRAWKDVNSHLPEQFKGEGLNQAATLSQRDIRELMTHNLLRLHQLRERRKEILDAANENVDSKEMRQGGHEFNAKEENGGRGIDSSIADKHRKMLDETKQNLFFFRSDTHIVDTAFGIALRRISGGKVTREEFDKLVVYQKDDQGRVLHDKDGKELIDFDKTFEALEEKIANATDKDLHPLVVHEAAKDLTISDLAYHDELVQEVGARLQWEASKFANATQLSEEEFLHYATELFEEDRERFLRREKVLTNLELVLRETQKQCINLVKSRNKKAGEALEEACQWTEFFAGQLYSGEFKTDDLIDFAAKQVEEEIEDKVTGSLSDKFKSKRKLPGRKSENT